MSAFTHAYFPKEPPLEQSKGFLVNAALHLNEMPENLPEELRKRIVNRVKNIAFNRYPESFGQSLIRHMAEWYGCSSEQIMVAPGSSAFIRLLLTYFGTHLKGKLVITCPSFIYYEQYCQSFHIPYDQWELNNNFDYDPSLLIGLPDYSVVFLATPNNPTGNTLPILYLRELLTNHKNSLFVVDEAYAEFASETMLPLIENFDNLVLLRTFSKAFCAAGIRCGILIGEKKLVAQLKVLQTPWQLSSFTIEAVREIIIYAKKTSWFSEQLKTIINEREKVYDSIRQIIDKNYVIYPSQANFLLIKSIDEFAHHKLLVSCANYGILVKDLSHAVRLSKCVRVTIGKLEENSLFLQALHKAIVEQK